MTQIMFETFNVPSMCIAMENVLSLYASGRYTGIVINSGHTVTNAVPIYCGHPLKHAITKTNIGGVHLTNYLMNVLQKKGYSFSTFAERDSVRDIKEKLGYVAIDYDKELCKLRKDIEKQYELPDGQIIMVSAGRFGCSEILFQPQLIHKFSSLTLPDRESKHYRKEFMRGIHNLVYDSIQECDADLREILYSNIVLSGGSSMFPGIDVRLQKEVSLLSIPKGIKVKIIAPPERKYSTWIGGSIMSCLSYFYDLCVDKAEYDEYGSTIVHFKCF
eukprot:303820_1